MTTARKLRRVGAATAVLTAVFAVQATMASAATSVSVTLNDARPSVTSVNYDFSWTNPSTANVQCIEVAFSLNADGTGGLPTGMGLAAATLNAYGQTSWTRNNVTGGQVVFTDATIRNAAAGANTLVVGGLTNPSGVGTYYMSVATFDSATVTSGECSGTVRDGAHYTAFAITDGQAVTLAIDPTLTFTVGGKASGTVCNGVTSNNATTSTTVPLGRLA